LTIPGTRSKVPGMAWGYLVVIVLFVGIPLGDYIYKRGYQAGHKAAREGKGMAVEYDYLDSEHGPNDY
jgi:hypothetical protein